MKKFMRNYGIMVIVLTVLTLGFSTVTLANDEDGKHPLASTELKFIGNVYNQPVFQLNFNNKEEDEVTVCFRDEDGNVLYADKLKGSNISKKYMLRSEDLNDGSLNVVVKVKKGAKTESFRINRSTSYVEDTHVQKIK